MASSFTARLYIPHFETDLTYVHLSMNQVVDALGRPSSPTQGGIITAEFNSTDNNAINEWMASPSMRLDGSIVYMQIDKKVPLRTIPFKNAYCVSMQEHGDMSGASGQVRTTIVISPEKIFLSGIELDNRWPNIE